MHISYKFSKTIISFEDTFFIWGSAYFDNFSLNFVLICSFLNSYFVSMLYVFIPNYNYFLKYTVSFRRSTGTKLNEFNCIITLYLLLIFSKTKYIAILLRKLLIYTCVTTKQIRKYPSLRAISVQSHVCHWKLQRGFWHI